MSEVPYQEDICDYNTCVFTKHVNIYLQDQSNLLSIIILPVSHLYIGIFITLE